MSLLIAKITGYDSPGFNNFGFSTSLNSAGNTALVGAYGYNNDGGAAYVFDSSNNNWNQTARITGKDIALIVNDLNRFGWSTALNSGGNIALIGAPAQYSSSGGAAYIFERIGNSWNQKVKINAGNNASELDYFGRSVALNSAGNVALVGAFQGAPRIGGSPAGAAYIFTGSGSNWARAARITGNDSPDLDLFGNAVSLNSAGNIALIGAYGKNQFSGAAYIFTGSGNNWNQVAKITGNDALLNKQFGLSVALNAAGNVALVGANINNFSTATGSAYIFTGSGSSWTQVAKISGEGDDNYAFGNKVSLNSSGNIALIGATRSAYIFVNSGNSWIKDSKITGGETAFSFNFGNAVSLNSSGNIALIGSFSEQTNGVNYAGAAYIFKIRSGQRITFDPLSTKTYGDSPFFLNATATSNLPVTFSGNNPNVATIIGSGVTIVGAGTCIITATQTGNSDYDAATPVSRTLTVLRAGQTISFPAIPTKTFGDPLFYLAGTSTSNLPLIYSGSNSSVATIIGSGVTIVGTGTCQITGYQTGNDNYSAATPVSRTLTVLRAGQTINLPSFYTGIYNETKVYDASTPQGFPLIYTGNTNIFSIAANNITFINTGITILTGYNTGSTNYTGITGTQQVKVNRAEAIIDFPYIPVFNVNITSGYTLSGTSNHNESTIVYSSSNSGAVSITGANRLLITGTGVGIITAYQAATSHYNEAFAQRSFEALNLRTPQIVAVSNLPNNVFFDTGSKYLQGYLQDEGVYNLKLHILEDDILCEKTLRLTCYNPNKKYIYKVNYPINIGFIKYNPLERLGISTFISDQNTRRYLAKTNISDPSIQNKINDFVDGLKNLNVWDKFKNIWILKSGYNSNDTSFYDLKNANFSGSIIGGIIKSISGYKITTNSFKPVSSRLSFANYPIKFTGNWTTMFLLQNYTGSLPTTSQAFLTNENYQASGFRMGYRANNKEFYFWNGESLPPGSGGFGLTETNSHLTKYSFVTASLSTGTLGYVYSGTAKLLVDNKSKIQSSAPYKRSNFGVENLSNPAGANYGFENNIAFFAVSDYDLSNYHSGIRDLARNTIYDNLNF